MRASWPIWLFLAVYLPILLAIAIDPLVSPHMPDNGKFKILAALPLSYLLIDGDVWDRALVALAWLPWIPVIASIPRIPRWLRDHREWERKAARRAEREAAASSAPREPG